MPDAVSAYLQWLTLQGRSERTVTERRRALARMAAALPVPLLEATTDDLMVWRASLAALSAATIFSYVVSARRFYAFAQEYGYLACSPAARLPAPPLPRRLPRPIAWDDLVLALSTAPPRIRPWLVLAAWCGLRAKEVALLRRECVLETAPVPVLLVAAGATKGHAPERAVPLCGFVLSEIPAWRLPRRGWAFPRADGRPGPNRPQAVSQYANAHLHGLGIGDTFHSLRHFFGSATYQAKRDILLVRDLLGHADVSSAQGYAAWDRPSAVAAVEAIPAPARLRAAGWCPALRALQDRGTSSLTGGQGAGQMGSGHPAGLGGAHPHIPSLNVPPKWESCANASSRWPRAAEAPFPTSRNW